MARRPRRYTDLESFAVALLRSGDLDPALLVARQVWPTYDQRTDDEEAELCRWLLAWCYLDHAGTALYVADAGNALSIYMSRLAPCLVGSGDSPLAIGTWPRGPEAVSVRRSHDSDMVTPLYKKGQPASIFDEIVQECQDAVDRIHALRGLPGLGPIGSYRAACAMQILCQPTGMGNGPDWVKTPRFLALQARLNTSVPEAIQQLVNLGGDLDGIAIDALLAGRILMRWLAYHGTYRVGDATKELHTGLARWLPHLHALKSRAETMYGIAEDMLTLENQRYG